MHKTAYQIVDRTDSKKVTEFPSKDGQLLRPMVELIAGAETAADELTEITGRAAIEAVLTLSAPETTGPKHSGKAVAEITWYDLKPTDDKTRVNEESSTI